MALKFLNKKGWHTGSLRNIENVWKAEQKHEAEQRKLEELRKQIQDEREKSEFRQMQEQAGLAPRQERLDFLYESGLAVGKGSSEGFKALQGPPAADSTSAAASNSSSKSAAPGALFEDKPQSANDAWRKLHSDPLLLIRQREQEAIARIKNNPIKMSMIKKTVEAEKNKEQDKEKKKKKRHKDGEKKRHKGHHHKRSKHEKRSSRHDSDLEDTSDDQQEKTSDRETSMQHEDRRAWHGKRSLRNHSDSEDANERTEGKRMADHSRRHSRREGGEYEEKGKNHSPSLHQNEKLHSSRPHSYPKYTHERDGARTSDRHHPNSEPADEDKKKHGGRDSHRQDGQPGYYNHRRRGVPKMSEEEKAARLREMQLDAELHEEQRSKRLKRAAEADILEEARASFSKGKNFLDAAQRSVYGTESGGSATIEESVRRRAYYSQGSSAAHESNAFRR